MRLVRIVRQSVKYNPQILHKIGELAYVEEEGEDCLQIRTMSGGTGTIDKDAVEDVEEHK